MLKLSRLKDSESCMIRLPKYKWGIWTMKKIYKGSSNLSVTLDKPTVIVSKSKKLLQLGNTRGLGPFSNCINIILLICIHLKH